MKKIPKKNDSEMQAEYDFSQAVRGKYARRYAEGTNVVVLEPDVARAFPNAKAVNSLLDEQRQCQQQLTDIVRGTDQVRIAKEAGKLIRLPAGDGMALVFFDSPEAPVRCAIEISKKLKEYPQLKLRMGIHSGPIKEVRDVNDRTNVAGDGINVARRVMMLNMPGVWPTK